MLHTTLDGARPSGQRSIVLDLNKTYTITGMQFPAGTQYAALGHVHKPQQLGEGVLAAYPGSLLQLDFGEGGEQKGINLLEVSAGRPVQLTHIPLASGHELRTLHVTHADLERKLDEARSFRGLLKVVVSAAPGTALAGLKDTVLKILPEVLAVELNAAAVPDAAPLLAREGLSRLELFERYYQQARGALPQEVRAAFLEAQRAVSEETREGLEA